MATEKKSKTWVKDILVAFIATTMSISLTFGTIMIVNYVNKKKEHILTAMMVMCSIEQFACDLEEIEEDTAYRDSIATWLLSLPMEDLAVIGEPLEEAYQIATQLATLNRDRKIEKIFSSNISTWKNMNNFRFVDIVGSCFSSMNQMEENYNKFIKDLYNKNDSIIINPNDYPGSTRGEKLLRNKELRLYLENIHIIRGYLRYYAENLRIENRKLMRLVNIPEKEVIGFKDNLVVADYFEDETINQYVFTKSSIDPDSVVVHISIARQIDSLLLMMSDTISAPLPETFL